MQELEVKLKKAHDEDTLSQLKASQLSVEVVRSQAEINANEKMAEERVRFQKEKQVLENELLRRRKEEISKVKNEFEAQLSALKLQVQQSDELRAKEVCFKYNYIKARNYHFYWKYSELKIAIYDHADDHNSQVQISLPLRDHGPIRCFKSSRLTNADVRKKYWLWLSGSQI